MPRGLHKYPDRTDATRLAIRRLAGSFSRPGGRFGQEDRILDVAIALEMLYGGMTGHKLAQRAAALLGEIAAEQKGTYDQAKGFYDVRSRIVHGKEPPSLAGCGRKGVRGDVRAAGMTAMPLSDALPGGLTACGGPLASGLVT